MDFILPPPKDTLSKQDNPEFQRFQQLCPGQDPGDSLMLKLSEATPNPRIIKTHLPFSLLNPALLSTAKVVYVMRNPLDTVLSYCHHCRLFISQKFQGTIEDFVDHFLDNMLMYGPYHTHILEALNQSSHPNLHIIHFEDMKADFFGEVQRLDVFLGTKLTKEQCQNVMGHCRFSAMKGRGAAFGKEDKVEIFDKETLAKDGSFFREGEAGLWKTQLTPELETKMKKWMKMNLPNVTFKCNK